jgi:hypothetical protein
MMMTKSRFVILLGTAVLVAGFAVAQTMSKTAREPQFENTEVKVW